MSGCTLVTALISPTHIFCANVGDSRCVLGSNKTTINLSEDHKPNNREEKKRIKRGGGFVLDNRVNGELAMSRAIGDFTFKDANRFKDDEYLVISYPDIAIHERIKNEDKILVVACDGVFDVLSNEETIAYITDIVLNENIDNVVENNIEKNNGVEVEIQVETTNNNVLNNIDNNIEKNSENNSTSPSSVEIAESLIDLALSLGSTDNISAIIIKFL
jgi:serine/threonine protein phosphatase PrpC